METTTELLPRTGAELIGQVGAYADVLTPEALLFLTKLHRRFDPARQHLLRERVVRERQIDRGNGPSFCVNTADVRLKNWTASPAPADL